jgi:hypothetical protein
MNIKVPKWDSKNDFGPLKRLGEGYMAVMSANAVAVLKPVNCFTFIQL